MRACPIPLQHPSEAIQLKGLGPVLCEKLTQALKAYCEANSLPMPSKTKRRQIPTRLHFIICIQDLTDVLNRPRSQ